jgi:Memo-like protein
VHLSGCAVSVATELLATGKFEAMTQGVDEDEHRSGSLLRLHRRLCLVFMTHTHALDMWADGAVVLQTASVVSTECSARTPPSRDLGTEHQRHTRRSTTPAAAAAAATIAPRSIEMHLPYVKKRMGAAPCAVVAIMVGATSESAEAKYGALLAPYLADPANFFIISSDFCHWGARFRYQVCMLATVALRWATAA